MGVFYTSRESVLPATTKAFRDCLAVDPKSVIDIDKEAVQRTIQFSEGLKPTFNPWRFTGAVAIALALLLGAIWTALHNLSDISKVLMNSFASFSGLVLGLLGGEAQKSAT